MPAARRLPPPWIVDEHPESFIVLDATGQALGYSTMTTSTPGSMRGAIRCVRASMGVPSITTHRAAVRLVRISGWTTGATKSAAACERSRKT
jgi:hypothetical protein